MNRVYKVIWSKAKHCYVVTSEIARSVTKSASSARSAGRKGAAVLAMAALLFTAGGMLGEAADPVVTDVTAGGTASVITANVITIKKDDSSSTSIAIDNVEHAKEAVHATAADRATKDGNGVVIDRNYVKNADAEVEAGGTYVKVDNTVGKNLSALDAQVQANADAVAAEAAARKAADQNNLKVGDGGVISKVSNDGTTPSAVKTLVLNKEGKNQITLSEDGIKVGTNSTVIASDGVFAGGDTAAAAKAALNADGSIKGADGQFAVGTDGSIRGADGNFKVAADGKVTANGGVDTNGDEIQTRGGNINAGAGAISGGAITGTTITGTSLSTQGGAISGGAITGTSLNTQDGEINGGDITSSRTIHAAGKITGNGLDAGSGAINGGSLSVTGAMEGNSLTLKGGNLDAGSGTITTTGNINGNNINADGTITTTNLVVNDGLKTDHITLGSDGFNQTDINKGNVTSIAYKNVGGVDYMAESSFNKDGSSITARTNEGSVDSTGNSTVGGKEISQYLGSNAGPDPYGKNVTRRMVRNDDGTFSMEDTAVDGKDKYSTVSQNAEERKVTVTDGTKTLTVTKNLTDGIVSETKDGPENKVKVTLTQGMNGTYKVETSGTSTEEIGGQKIENYKGGLKTEITGDETHYVTENQTNTVDGTLEETVKGKVTEDYQDALETTVGKDETHYVKGNQTNTVDGTLEETVKGKVTEDYQDALETTVGKDETHYVKGNQTNTVDGTLEETVKENVTEVYQKDLSTTVGGKQTTTVTGDSSLSAKNITNTAEGGTIYNKSKDILNEASGDIINFADGEIGNTATKITNITGNNTVTSDTKGTTFENKANSTAIGEGTVTKTTISGNTLETGRATMDYADVKKDLTVEGETNLKNTKVDGTLNVTGETRTGTLHVNGNGYVGGDLNVEGNIETHDAELSENSRQVVTGRQLYRTNERVDKLDNRIKKVGANAAALAALRPGDFNPDDKFSIAAGFGSYRNASAAALGLFYRPNENVILSLGTSFGDGENMVNAGVSVKFGRGKSMAERRKEMADEVSGMRDEMKSQNDRIAELEEMLKKQSELIEKLSKES
ncbi:ESPR-type extended signal peptide-containing protein [uncultured Dialister sp.]|uniref:ESPR-type extended signal peptide-containing protein n=1 Tax=uncultured Dialister sp. TaxID=278064 RepID=UPI0026DC8C35|nr:ESPR-type extended signal peptide-containing protein [uncultured Dialister sp.]